MNSEHYFDWAATAPCDEKILKEALETAIKYDGNPSSAHKEGKEARKIFEKAREGCAKCLGVKASQIFFTSGGTESDHIPLLSVLTSPAKSGRIILSAVEHPALREECLMLKKLGYEIVSVNPDKNGFISPQSIAENLTPDTVFVTVMAVNNETGCIQPFYEIADIITKASNGKKKPHFHVDCVQAAGKIPLNLSYKGIDSAAFSAHKISGPRGIGILYLSKPVNSFLTGGGQEQNIRSGTENLFGALSFSKCLEKYFITEANSESTKRFEQQKEWTVDFLKKLK
ncbi:cysteine desulfurase family protein, partial [Treponema sp.]|uniref:cysteine desulfurase family protein n=1 Tax=Treponema sp. TaxID=166 RepID=UPI00388E1431